MDLIITGVGLLLLFPMWRHLKITLLETHKQKLIELRDDLRNTYFENGWDLNSSAYRQLRDLLNGYSRYAESFTYSEFNYIENAIRKNPQLQAAMKARFEAHFSDVPSEQIAYVRKLRTEARRVMMSHMIFSSFPLAALTLVLFPIVGVFVVTCNFARGLKLNEFSFFIKTTISRIAQVVFAEDLVEEYSLRQP
jgi:hypothetical protein